MKSERARSRLPHLPRLARGGCFDASNDVDWHTHAQDEIVLVTAGECAVRCGEAGPTLEGTTGSLLVLPAGVPQYQKTRGRTRTLYLQFDAPRSAFDPSPPRLIDVPADGYVRRWMEDLVAIYLATTKVAEPVTAGLLTAVLAECGRVEAKRSTQSRLHPAVRGALALIEANLAAPLTIDDLADAAGISASHLTALFRKEVGDPPLHYRQRLRMDHACKLLRDPLLSVKQVARQCGYDDVNYFTRLFRHTHGTPPAQWRSRA